MLRQDTLEENMKKTYTIVWDMCSDELQAKLKAVTDFKAEVIDEMNVLKLLEEIRKIMFNFQDKRYVYHNIYMTWKWFYDIKQLPNETVQ